MRTLKEKISSDSISFVYICSQSSSKMWLKQIRKYNVKGRHLLISDFQNDNFKKRFNLKAFTAYVIIGANIKIHRGISLSSHGRLVCEGDLEIYGTYPPHAFDIMGNS